MRNPTEFIFNILFGLSFIWWAIAGQLFTDDAFSTVRISISFLHMTAGILIILRRPVRLAGSFKEVMICIPALAAAGLVFAFARPTDNWKVWNQVLFCAATLWTIYSLTSLGKSFAVFPSLRTVVVNGPYGILRHPAYLGELVMSVCCVFAATSYWVLAAFAFAVVTVVVRILTEERLLATSDSYISYKEKIRWRLVPWIW